MLVEKEKLPLMTKKLNNFLNADITEQLIGRIHINAQSNSSDFLSVPLGLYSQINHMTYFPPLSHTEAHQQTNTSHS